MIRLPVIVLRIPLPPAPPQQFFSIYLKSAIIYRQPNNIDISHGNRRFLREIEDPPPTTTRERYEDPAGRLITGVVLARTAPFRVMRRFPEIIRNMPSAITALRPLIKS